MDHSDNTSLCHWLSRFQRLEMTAEQIADPAKSVTVFAQAIGEAASGMAFDTDPAAFGQLLHDLAPADLKSGDQK